jgi:hypothetical protein
METRSYQVELVYRQTVRYEVQAQNPEEAEELAMEKWRNEERGILLGHECNELHHGCRGTVPRPRRRGLRAGAALPA